MLLNEMVALKPLDPNSFHEGTLDVTLMIPAKRCSETLLHTVEEAHRFLNQRYPNSFEILLIPNPSPGDSQDHSMEICQEISQKFSAVRVCPHTFPPGKGAAIRTGFTASKGKWIFFTDADLPYDLEFFDRAAQKLKDGCDFVSGNRRLPESHFQIPVNLLRLVYRRHRLGLWFNRWVRWLLPISTTDTQAGIKALSRRLAAQSFSTQMCPGFLFDLEIFMTAHGHGYTQAELPVTLHLNSEKSTVRILRECLLVANWLIRISWKNLRSGYGVRSSVGSRYRQASLMTRLFLAARWHLTPYPIMASRLPQQGRILDLGCGHGLFALAMAIHSPSRKILGIDHDRGRVQLGSQATADLPNIRLETGNLMAPPLSEGVQPYSGIAMIDVMHYFDPLAQETLLYRAFQLLDQGGTLLVREVDPQAGLASSWNRFYEKLATGMGFTQAEKKGLHFRSRQGWKDLMEKSGFKVSSERCSSFLFADILYVCERPHS